MLGSLVRGRFAWSCAAGMALLLASPISAGAVSGRIVGPSVAGTSAVEGDATSAATRAEGHPGVADFIGIMEVQMKGCSAFLVRFPQSLENDRAMMMTNGHCYEGGDPKPGTYPYRKPSKRTGILLDAAGNNKTTLQADTLLYAIDDATDIALYQLTTTFAQVKQQFQIPPLTLATSAPKDGTVAMVSSGRWRKLIPCTVEKQVLKLREDPQIYQESIRYAASDACKIGPGTSGAPLIDTATGLVVGINNTVATATNDSRFWCTVNYPCEVDEAGNKTFLAGRGYAQQTWRMTTCVNSERVFDLAVPGCQMPKQAGTRT